MGREREGGKGVRVEVGGQQPVWEGRSFQSARRKSYSFFVGPGGEHPRSHSESKREIQQQGCSFQDVVENNLQWDALTPHAMKYNCGLQNKRNWQTVTRV